MIRPTFEIVDQWAKVAKQFPHLVDYLSTWRQSELERLPHIKENVAFAQGRCAMLTEVLDLIKTAPEVAAKFK